MTPVQTTWAIPAATLSGGGDMSPSSYLDSVPMHSFIRLSDMPGTYNSACLALSRAVKKGELARIANGLYFKGEQTRYGITTPPPDWVVLELMEHRGVGPAGWSAANALGLTTQVPAQMHIATVLRPPTGFPTLKFVRRNNAARLSLNHIEIGVLEVMRVWDTMTDGDWPSLAKTLRKLANEGRFRATEVFSAANWEHNAATKKNIALLKTSLENLRHSRNGRARQAG